MLQHALVKVFGRLTVFPLYGNQYMESLLTAFSLEYSNVHFFSFFLWKGHNFLALWLYKVSSVANIIHMLLQRAGARFWYPAQALSQCPWKTCCDDKWLLLVSLQFSAKLRKARQYKDIIKFSWCVLAMWDPAVSWESLELMAQIYWILCMPQGTTKTIRTD